MITLHNYPSSGNCYKVRVLLTQLGWSSTAVKRSRSPTRSSGASRKARDSRPKPASAAGGRNSIADIALYAYTDLAEEARLSLERYPALRAWLARVREQPRRIQITQR